MYGKALVAVLVLALCLGCTVSVEKHPAKPKPALEPSGNTGILELTVNTKGAAVHVDDSLYGMIRRGGRAQDFYIPAGKHSLAVKKFGYQAFSAKIAVEAGAVNTLEIKLERLPTEVVTLPEDKPKAGKK